MRAVAMLATLAMVSGCAERFAVRTYPTGAKVTVNDQVIGITPVNMYVPRGDLQKEYRYRIEKENYVTIDGAVRPRVAPGRIVGAIFTAGILLAFRGIRAIPEVITELTPIEPRSAGTVGKGSTESIESRLKRIDSLHNQGLLSDEEYKRLRSDVLDELRGTPR